MKPYIGLAIDGTRRPMHGVYPVVSCRAEVLGRYLSSRIAASTRASVSLAMRSPRPFNTFDTVLVETPARWATSLILLTESFLFYRCLSLGSITTPRASAATWRTPARAPAPRG